MSKHKTMEGAVLLVWGDLPIISHQAMVNSVLSKLTMPIFNYEGNDPVKIVAKYLATVKDQLSPSHIIVLHRKSVTENANISIETVLTNCPREIRIMLSWAGKVHSGLISAHRYVWDKVIAEESIQIFMEKYPELTQAYIGSGWSDVISGYIGSNLNINEICKGIIRHLNGNKLPLCTLLINTVLASISRACIQIDHVEWNRFSQLLSEVTKRQIKLITPLVDWSTEKDDIMKLIHNKQYSSAMEKINQARDNYILPQQRMDILDLYSRTLWYVNSMTSSEKNKIHTDMIMFNSDQLAEIKIPGPVLSNSEFYADKIPQKVIGRIKQENIRSVGVYENTCYLFLVDGNIQAIKNRGSSLERVEEEFPLRHNKHFKSSRFFSLDGKMKYIAHQGEGHVFMYSEDGSKKLGAKGGKNWFTHTVSNIEPCFFQWEKNLSLNQYDGEGKMVKKYPLPWCLPFKSGTNLISWGEDHLLTMTCLQIKENKHISMFVQLDRNTHQIKKVSNILSADSYMKPVAIIPIGEDVYIWLTDYQSVLCIYCTRGQIGDLLIRDL